MGQVLNTLPFEMMVTVMAKEFPLMADDLISILDEPYLEDEEALEQLFQKLRMYHARMLAGMVPPPKTNLLLYGPEAFPDQFKLLFGAMNKSRPQS